MPAMCLVALAIRRHPRLPLLLAANRDEYHARPARPAAPWVEDAAVVGGRDLEAGGAWLAAHRSGRFAVVTNFRRPGAGKGMRSRGELVRDFVLGDGSPEAFLGALATRRGDYAPFNLVVGDAEDAWWLESESGTLDRFAAGIHAFSNGPVRAPWPKCQAAAAAVARTLRDEAPSVSALMVALGDTSPAADAELPDTGVGLAMERLLSPVHIVGDTYGTRASTLLALAADGRHLLAERSFGPGARATGDIAWRVEGAGWAPLRWPDTL
jgi:uncharacterized protein with NRDE domain